jgi:hypothetical protein
MAGQPGPVAAGPLDADKDDGAEALQPAQQPAVPGGVGGERLDAEQAADVVEGGGDVDVEVGVDPSGDLIWHGGHGSSLLLLGGGAPAGRDGGQDNDGPLRQAPRKSLRPTGQYRVGVRAKSTDRYQDNPRIESVSRYSLGQTWPGHPPGTLASLTDWVVDAGAPLSSLPGRGAEHGYVGTA